jgi:prepilin-type N-terminal cleavage/methylation domain-containing protein
MNVCAPQHRRGFTLIEIAIVVGLILILTAIGIDMSKDLIPRYRTKKAAQQFAAHVNQCRMIAIRANRECMIWMKAGDDDLDDTTTNTGKYWMAMGNKSSGSSRHRLHHR